MTHKQIDVVCPCCSTILTVDVLTEKVLRSASPREVDETGKAVLDEGRWDSAAERVAGRQARGQDSLESALEKERQRSDDLEDLFDKAKKKISRRAEEQE